MMKEKCGVDMKKLAQRLGGASPEQVNGQISPFSEIEFVG